MIAHVLPPFAPGAVSLPGDVGRLMDALASATAQLEVERKRTQDLAVTLTAAEDAITTLRSQHDASTKVAGHCTFSCQLCTPAKCF